MLQITDVYAGIVTLALLGFVLNRAILLAERWLIGWHRSISARPGSEEDLALKARCIAVHPSESYFATSRGPTSARKTFPNSDSLSHVICSPLVSWSTSRRTLRSMSRISRLGVAMYFSRAPVKGL
jgi:hypothetical protein